MMKRKLTRFMAGLTAMTVCVGMAIPTNVCLAAESTESVEVESAAAEDPGSFESRIAAAKAALSQAEENQKAAAEKYQQGSLGFIDWMLAKDDLTAEQEHDLRQARSVITKASEENFSKWAGGTNTGLPEKRGNMVTCVWDYDDAASLENIEASFPILRKINEIRATDQNYVGEMKRDAAGTNFYFMAVAQTGADRGAGLGGHSLLQVDCENLAFRIANPENAWRSEIGTFNMIKERLGKTVLDNESDVREIERLASAEGKKVGHYTNLFWAADQVMGVGYTNYRATSCYNAAVGSAYRPKFAIYTIDEFEALFREYYATVDPDETKRQVDAARENLQILLDQKHGNCTEHVFGDGVEVAATCKEAGGIVYTCSKCGYQKIEHPVEALGHNFVEGVCTRCKITTPKKITDVCWTISSNEGLVMDVTDSQSYEQGQEVEVSIEFQSASEYPAHDKFTVSIADPAIMSYEPQTNSTGIMHMNRIGKTTVTIYPTENPAVSKSFTISVTDVGGHDYVIKQAVAGVGKTTKVCSKCKAVEEVTLPTRIRRVTWWKDGSGIFSPGNYEIGDEIKLEVEYAGLSDHVDNAEFGIQVSDPSVATAKVLNDWRYKGALTIVGNGDAVVTVYVKYDPSVKKTFTLHVGKETEKKPDEKENKPGKTQKPSDTDKPGKTQKPSDTGKPGKTQKLSDTNKSGQTGETGKTDKTSEKEKTGKTVTKGGYSYRIVSASTVSMVKCKDKNAVKAVIPKTVKIAGKTYKVTSIGKSAFQGCAKLSKVTIGKNVVKIGADAFQNCKKLSMVTIQSTKLKSIGKNAFKGIRANARIKVPASRLKAYQALLKGKGQGKKVKIVK